MSYQAKDFDEIRALTDDELEELREANGKAWFQAQMRGEYWVQEIQTEMRMIGSEIDWRRFR